MKNKIAAAAESTVAKTGDGELDETISSLMKEIANRDKQIRKLIRDVVKMGRLDEFQELAAEFQEGLEKLGLMAEFQKHIKAYQEDKL